jgi:hypothetical protein
MIDRYEELLGFVKENRETVSYVVDTDKQREKDDAAAAAAAENEDDGGEIGRSRTTRGVKGMLKNQERSEAQYESHMQKELKAAQEQAFNDTQAKNDDQKNALLDEYKQRLANGNLSADERAAILAEMEGKMAMINEMVDQERAAQDAAL